MERTEAVLRRFREISEEEEEETTHNPNNLRAPITLHNHRHIYLTTSSVLASCYHHMSLSVQVNINMRNRFNQSLNSVLNVRAGFRMFWWKLLSSGVGDFLPTIPSPNKARASSTSQSIITSAKTRRSPRWPQGTRPPTAPPLGGVRVPFDLKTLRQWCSICGRDLLA